MPRWMLIVVLIVVAIWGLVLFVIPEGARQKARYSHLHSIGRELIRSTNSTRLVNVDPDLQAQLFTLLSTTTQVSKVLSGDEPPPIGDGNARYRLVLANAAGQTLTIRLGRDGTNQFYVLGFRSTLPKP